jgi:hypothetical protein
MKLTFELAVHFLVYCISSDYCVSFSLLHQTINSVYCISYQFTGSFGQLDQFSVIRLDNTSFVFHSIA